MFIFPTMQWQHRQHPLPQVFLYLARPSISLMILRTLLSNFYREQILYIDPDFTINGCGVLFANTVYALFIEITGLGKNLFHKLRDPVSQWPQAFGASSRKLGIQLLPNPVELRSKKCLDRINHDVNVRASYLSICNGPTYRTYWMQPVTLLRIWKSVTVTNKLLIVSMYLIIFMKITIN